MLVTLKGKSAWVNSFHWCSFVILQTWYHLSEIGRSLPRPYRPSECSTSYSLLPKASCSFYISQVWGYHRIEIKLTDQCQTLGLFQRGQVGYSSIQHYCRVLTCPFDYSQKLFGNAAMMAVVCHHLHVWDWPESPCKWYCFELKTSVLFLSSSTEVTEYETKKENTLYQNCGKKLESRVNIIILYPELFYMKEMNIWTATRGFVSYSEVNSGLYCLLNYRHRS